MALWTTVYFLMVIIKFRVVPCVRACCPAIPDCHDPEREAAYLAKKLERQAAEARKIAELKVVSPVLAKVASVDRHVDVTNPIGSGAAKPALAVPNPAEALAAAAPAAAPAAPAAPAATVSAVVASPAAAPSAAAPGPAGDAAAAPAVAVPADKAAAAVVDAVASKKGGPSQEDAANSVDSAKVAKYAKKRFDKDELPEGWDWKEDDQGNIFYEPPEGVFDGQATYDDPRSAWEKYLEAHMQYAKCQLAAGKRVSWAH